MPRIYAVCPYWSLYGHRDGCRRRPAVAQPRFCHWTASQATSPPAHVTSGMDQCHRRRNGRGALSLRQILRRATPHVRQGTVTSQCRHSLFVLPPASTESMQWGTVKSPLTRPLLHHTALPQMPATLPIAQVLQVRQSTELSTAEDRHRGSTLTHAHRHAAKGKSKSAMIGLWAIQLLFTRLVAHYKSWTAQDKLNVFARDVLRRHAAQEAPARGRSCRLSRPWGWWSIAQERPPPYSTRFTWTTQASTGATGCCQTCCRRSMGSSCLTHCTGRPLARRATACACEPSVPYLRDTTSLSVNASNICCMPILDSHRAGPLATACAAGTGARLLGAQDWPPLQQLRPVLLQPIAKRAALPTVVGAAPGFAPGELSASLSLSPASPNRISMGSTSSHRTSSSSSLSAPQLVVPNEYDMVL